MLTQAPVPEWKILFKSFETKTSLHSGLADTWCRNDEVGGLLSRSAWSIALIAQWKEKSKGSSINVWVPDFFCNSSLDAVRQTGANLFFYKLMEDMSPDISSLDNLLNSGKPDLVILVHYFGKPAPASVLRDFCGRHQAWLIEDAAHVLRPVNNIGVYGDFILYSPHKHLPIPDGAILVIRSKGPSKFTADQIAAFGPEENWPSQLDALQRKMNVHGKSWNTKWLVKRIIQKFLFFSYPNPKTEFREPVDPGIVSPAIFLEPSMSKFSKNVLLNLSQSLADISKRRQCNQLLLDELVKETEEGRAEPGDRPLHREWTPYLLMYKTGTENCETIFKQWQAKGIPVTTWPDLPPEVTADRDNHLNAWALRHSRLYLPDHQSLRMDEFVRSFSKKGMAEEQPEQEIALQWNTCNEQQWNELMRNAGHSNLLHSWYYGNAKSKQGGWKIRRGIFYKKNEPIAFVQILQKKIAGLAVISRINRGPVALKPLDRKEQFAVYSLLKGLGNWLHGRFLSTAPELPLTGTSLLMMLKMGFRKRALPNYGSAWIDLTQDSEQIRKQLDGKWRNKLLAAEKIGIALEMGTDDIFFAWMMDKYNELMEMKDFVGPSIELLEELHKESIHNQPLLIFKAKLDEEAVAGICIAQHGTAATYLIGWNGIKGREIKANQYLVWQVIMYLKQAGMQWLDLGGIDEEGTAGISVFKLGLNGKRYENVGEYIKL